MPSYSTDKGFTGSAGGLGGSGTKDKDKNKGKGGLTGADVDKVFGGAGDFAGFKGTGGTAPKSSDPIGGDIGRGAKDLAKDFGNKGRGAGYIPDGMYPPHSRTKVKKGVSRPDTVGNIVTGVINALTPGLGTVLGSEEVTGVPGGAIPGLGFEGPVGDSEYAESDPSQLGAKSQLAASEVAPPPSKKKKNSPLGNIVGTLLADAGGTLVAG